MNSSSEREYFSFIIFLQEPISILDTFSIELAKLILSVEVL